MGRPLPAMLESMLEATPVRPALERLVRERRGGDARIDDIEVQPVQRGVIRYVVRLEGDRGDGTWPIIGKVYDDADECGFTRWRRLWDDGFDPRSPDATPIHIPEPYAYVDELKLMLMEQAPGEPLKGVLKKKSRREAGPHMRAFGETLARLHGWPMPDETPFTVADHLDRRCRPGPAALVEAYPELAGVVAEIVEATTRLDRAWLEAGELRRTHGDCHLGQMHVHGDEFWMLDLDPMQPAHPAYDVAMVLTAIDRLVTPKKADDLAERRDDFLAAYFERCPWSIASRLPVYQALILFKQACKRFRWQDEAGWEAAVPDLVRRAAACLAVQAESPDPQSVADVAALDARLRGRDE